jgi:hypothetical protein
VQGVEEAVVHFGQKLYNNQKGRAIKQFALLLGNGVMVNTGEFWIVSDA